MTPHLWNLSPLYLKVGTVFQTNYPTLYPGNIVDSVTPRDVTTVVDKTNRQIVSKLGVDDTGRYLDT